MFATVVAVIDAALDRADGLGVTLGVTALDVYQSSAESVIVGRDEDGILWRVSVSPTAVHLSEIASEDPYTETFPIPTELITPTPVTSLHAGDTIRVYGIHYTVAAIHTYPAGTVIDISRPTVAGTSESHLYPSRDALIDVVSFVAGEWN